MLDKLEINNGMLVENIVVQMLRDSRKHNKMNNVDIDHFSGYLHFGNNHFLKSFTGQQ